jgi:MoaA/NifB/PqqE/SkfB family radical SAM enzyme
MTFISPKSKPLHHLDRLQAIKEGKRPPPVNCELDFSLRCDYACQGCHFAYTHTRGPWAGKAEKPEGAIPGGDLIDYDFAVDIFHQLAGYGVKSLTITGGGEPTIHPRFDDLVLAAHNAGLELGIYTHGSHLRGERAAWMKQHFKWIYFSFDAHDVESYKLHKGVNRFDRVCDNIRNIVALPGDATIGMGFLLAQDNYQHAYTMQKLGRDLGVDYVQFRPLIEYNQKTPNVLIEDTSWITEAVQLLQQYDGDPFVIADISRFVRYRDWTGHGYPTCFWSALQTVVTPNGLVWRCTNKREHPDGLLGDLTMDSFADIWQRSGGACSLTNQCRIACKGDLGNETLTELFAPVPHQNFV